MGRMTLAGLHQGHMWPEQGWIEHLEGAGAAVRRVPGGVEGAVGRPVQLLHDREAVDRLSWLEGEHAGSLANAVHLVGAHAVDVGAV